MEEIRIQDKVFVPYIHRDDVEETVQQLAEQLNADLEKEDVLFLSVLNGSFVFAADLYRKTQFFSRLSFIKLKSYKEDLSSGEVRELIGMEESLEGRTIVIIEDIIDTGTTLKDLVTKIRRKNPARVLVVALFYKPEAYTADLPLDYIGMSIPNDFIIGYGLDYNGYGRHLPDIYKVRQ